MYKIKTGATQSLQCAGWGLSLSAYALLIFGALVFIRQAFTRSAFQPS